MVKQIKVGRFSQQDLAEGKDTQAVEKHKTDELRYIKSKIVRVKGVPFMDVWVTNQFSI